MLVGYDAFVMRGDGYCEPSVLSYSDGVSAFILGVVGFEEAGIGGYASEALRRDGSGERDTAMVWGGVCGLLPYMSWE